MEIKWIFNATLSFNKLWNTKILIKINLDLMVFIQEIICLKKIKDGAYITNLNEYTDVGTHWIALYFRNIEIIYFDSFEVEHVPKEI